MLGGLPQKEANPDWMACCNELGFTSKKSQLQESLLYSSLSRESHLNPPGPQYYDTQPSKKVRKKEKIFWKSFSPKKFLLKLKNHKDYCKLKAEPQRQRRCK
jgi:hypothetical protein